MKYHPTLVVKYYCSLTVSTEITIWKWYPPVYHCCCILDFIMVVLWSIKKWLWSCTFCSNFCNNQCMVSGLAQCVQVGIWKMQIHDFYILFQNVFMLIIYIKMLLDCDWLISVQLISNSAKIYNSSAKICNKQIWLVEKTMGSKINQSA